MKKIVLSSLFILITFSIVLVVKMPASFVLSQVASQTQSLYFENAQGSIWTGSASQVQVKLPAGVVNRRAKVIHLGQVNWDLSFWALLTANVALSLDTQHSNQSLKTDLRLNVFSKSLELGETKFDVALPFAMTFYPVPAKINGKAELNLQRLSLDVVDNMPIIQHVEGQLLVSQLEVAVTKPVSLGDFGVNIFSDEQGVLNATLSDVNATVAVSGKGQFNQTTKMYSANGEVTPTPKTDKMVVQALGFIAAKQASGSYTMNYNGVLK